jgi:hypothetical protein
MPRDEWAKLKSKERGQRAARSGQCYHCKPMRPIKGKKADRRIKRQAEALRCPHCNASAPEAKRELFKDGTTHVRLSCGKCNKFIKWLGRK